MASFFTPATPTIAFAIATAIPFGLAIRDTATDRYHTLDEDLRAYHQADEWDRDDDDDDDDEALETFGRETMLEGRELERLEEQLRATERAELAAELRGLYGAEVATMGTKLAGIELGKPRGENDVHAIGWNATLLDDGVTTHALQLDLTRSLDCSILAGALDAAWGDSASSFSESIWLNPTIGQRAVFDSCSLTFERVAGIDAWLAKSRDAVVPMAIVGTSGKALIDTLGERATVDGNAIVWSGLGIGVGHGTTSLSAFTRGGKIVGLLAAVNTDDTTRATVEARVTQLVGKQPEAKTEDIPFEPTVWKTVPKITLEPGPSSFNLRIGEQLDQ